MLDFSVAFGGVNFLLPCEILVSLVSGITHILFFSILMVNIQLCSSSATRLIVLKEVVWKLYESSFSLDHKTDV